MPATQSDFNFIGPSYTAPNPQQDRQVCVNYYLEIDKTTGAKTPTGLLGTPGLIQVASAVGL